MESNTPHEDKQTDNVNNEENITLNNKTDSGLDENIAGLLCYLFPACIIFLIIEKKNRFIRFHAFQAIFVAVAVILVSAVLSVIPFLGWIVLSLLSPATLVLMIFMMYKAYNKEMYKLPYVGDLAEKQVNNS